MLRSCVSLALLAAVAVSSVSAQTAVDDNVCVWRWREWSCSPTALCSYQYKFGDLTPSQSCRVRPLVNKLPQQMHLAYAGESTGTGMTISYATFEQVKDRAVWIGSSPDTLIRRPDIVVSGDSYYSEGKYSLYQHHATVTGLTPNTKYYYKVGSSSDPAFTSAVSSFTTARVASDNTPFDVGVYGDLGFGEKGEQSTEYINTLGDKLSFIYHVGDIGYADNAGVLTASQALGFFYEEVYNKWMNSMTPIMSKVPYMVTVGNHEAECHSLSCLTSSYKKDRLGNYTAYNARFKMPSAESKGAKSMWYSFEYGPIHFSSISSETDYKDSPGNAYTGRAHGNFGNQVAWLEADLQKAVANRANVPWIIVGMHRPMYHRVDVDKNFQPTGDSLALQKAFEDLFIKYGVDLVITGHEHSYERHYPIAKGRAVMDGVSPDGKIYSNPKAPVHIVTGAPGNPEVNHGSGKNTAIPWNVMETAAYGISTMRVTRNSLTLKFITTGDQKVLDEFIIIKN